MDEQFESGTRRIAQAIQAAIREAVLVELKATVGTRPAATQDRYLSPEHAAEFLGVAVATLAAWRGVRFGPTFTRLGRRIAYREADLRAFAEATTVRPRPSRRRAPRRQP